MPENDPVTEQFIKEYGDLRDKHKRDFISIPRFVPTDRGTWELQVIPQVVSTEEQAVPSPFIGGKK